MSNKIGTELVVDLTQVKNKDKNKFLPLHKQEVRDERGKKRLHGAFTGGFSAGYFNTVGSKEGWQPSAFVSKKDLSSEDKINSKYNFKPEDFMDEEDLDAFQKKNEIQINDKFQSSSKDTYNEKLQNINFLETTKNNNNHSETTTKILFDKSKFKDFFLGPPSLSIGVELLKKLGWREGQGIGVKKKRKEYQNDVTAAELLFAPKEVSIKKELLKSKNDHLGLGYDPKLYAPEFNIVKNNRENTEKTFLGIKGGGFGLGVFDEDDEGDEMDLYGNTNMNDYDIYENTKEHQKQQEKLKISQKKSANLKQKLETGFDGKQSLPGFVFAKKEIIPTVYGAQFSAPNDFKPNPPINVTAIPTAKHDPESRRVLLGEEKINAPERKLFEMISSKTQDKINEIKELVNKKTSKIDSQAETTQKLDKKTALEALKGYIPFENDPAKQLRYKNFLNFSAGLLKTEVVDIPESFTLANIEHEKLEFIKAGKMFKPLSNFMASKFTSQGTEELPTKSKFVPKRTTKEWVPSRLLLKRFNVKNPFPNKPDSGLQPVDKVDPRDKLDKIDVLNKEAMLEIINERDRIYYEGKSKKEIKELEDDASKEEEANMQMLAENEIVKGRPSMDIFKAIFANSDSDSDTDDSDIEKIPLTKNENKKKDNLEVFSKDNFASTNSSTLGNEAIIDSTMAVVEKCDVVDSSLTESNFKPKFRKKELRKKKKISNEEKDTTDSKKKRKRGEKIEQKVKLSFGEEEDAKDTWNEKKIKKVKEKTGDSAMSDDDDDEDRNRPSAASYF
ncbi:hypothetical protein HK099_004123 [Clydaea vesicula]|uniref:G-patch domain-containing protein n=1 Tax=Clydaea vesicula TaxID=447962 RepID=A0AAD5U0V9_9FUNG|nr:hypothetical protein HK099_004123 [Clydaea vesicula]